MRDNRNPAAPASQTSRAIKEPVITLSAGPVAVFPRVMQGLARTVHYDYDPYFQDFYEQVVGKATRALRAKDPALILHCDPAEIGRAPGRERGCPYVLISVVAVYLKKQKTKKQQEK